MEWAKLVSDIINNKKPKKVLDLWAQRWYFSILAASYWAEVDAVDHFWPSKSNFPEYLKWHPNISFHQCDIKDFKIKKNYDLVIVKHVIMFMEKDRTIWNLLPQIYDNLTRWWVTFLTYYLPHSYLMKNDETLTKYEINDFKNTWKNFILKDFWRYENPVKEIRNETHYIWYIVLQK